MHPEPELQLCGVRDPGQGRPGFVCFTREDLLARIGMLSVNHDPAAFRADFGACKGGPQALPLVIGLLEALAHYFPRA
ncbi:MAG: hypothetical protein CMM29_00885 [Rhodospirillaceae bacterium]|nr:hypothetical protein [Rhodospirillaceae bacterium]